MINPAHSSLSPEVRRLMQFRLRLRWQAVSGIWLVVGLPSLILLHAEIGRLLEFFTWTGLRYSLIYNPIASMGLILCVAFTLSTLLWQSVYEVFGLSRSQQKMLEGEVARIRSKGPTHWLWSQIVESRDARLRLPRPPHSEH